MKRAITPGYLGLSDNEWKGKFEAARRLLSDCRCCPRECRVNRSEGQKGSCGAGSDLVIAAADAHFGEEPPISGSKGSGTIFFTYCPMDCVYCQNYPFSQLGQGRARSIKDLASIILSLQEKGCHNINLVTPTHFVPQIIFSVREAMDMGFKIPILYNTSSFDSMEALSLMEDIADIYLADMRYSDPNNSARYSGQRDYPQISRTAIKEMYRQVGTLEMDGDGIARRGLIIRHLLLPERIAGSGETFRFIAKELSKKVSISLMSQYYPAYQASNYPELNRTIHSQEYNEALSWLEESGLIEGWIQDSPISPR